LQASGTYRAFLDDSQNPTQKNHRPALLDAAGSGGMRACLHGFGADPVHDLRVALRRCRSLADGLMALDPDPDWKAMKKAGRRLFQRLGACATCKS